MENPTQETEKTFNTINVTPLVDVSLVLVLIFMVTSPFFVKPLMPVQLPEASSAESEDRRNITVSISPEHGFAINEIPLTKAALLPELRRQIKQSGFSFVLIRADERVPYGEVEDVMKIAKQARAQRIAFATSPRMQR